MFNLTNISESFIRNFISNTYAHISLIRLLLALTIFQLSDIQALRVLDPLTI